MIITQTARVTDSTSVITSESMVLIGDHCTESSVTILNEDLGAVIRILQERLVQLAVS